MLVKLACWARVQTHHSYVTISRLEDDSRGGATCAAGLAVGSCVAIKLCGHKCVKHWV